MNDITAPYSYEDLDNIEAVIDKIWIHPTDLLNPEGHSPDDREKWRNVHIQLQTHLLLFIAKNNTGGI